MQETKKEMAARIKVLERDLKGSREEFGKAEATVTGLNGEIDHLNGVVNRLQDAVSSYEEQDMGKDSDGPTELDPNENAPRAKSYHQMRVEKFMELGGQGIPVVVCVPSLSVRRLRAKLVVEEGLEVANALGVPVRVENMAVTIMQGDFGCDVVKVADECADLSVVTVGTLSAFGVADLSLFEEVDRANLEKVSGDILIDKHGKIQKPKGWTRPRVGKVLLDQGYGVSAPESAE